MTGKKTISCRWNGRGLAWMYRFHHPDGWCGKKYNEGFKEKEITKSRGNNQLPSDNFCKNPDFFDKL
jgi:hypothetical protein